MAPTGGWTLRQKGAIYRNEDRGTPGYLRECRGGTAGGTVAPSRRSGAGWSGLQLCIEEGDLLQNGVNDVLIS
jgi:hypothetical protein